MTCQYANRVVRHFYVKLVEKTVQKLPLNDALIKDLRAHDPNQRLEMPISAGT